MIRTFAAIDVNLACPVKKISKKARGGHWLRERVRLELRTSRVSPAAHGGRSDAHERAVFARPHARRERQQRAPAAKTADESAYGCGTFRLTR